MKANVVANGDLKCRLLYVVGQLGAGGLERQLFLLLQAMDRDRYRPEVVIWNFSENDTYVPHMQKLGIPLHSFPRRYNALKKILALRRLILKKKPEVVHSYSFYTNIAAFFSAFGTKTISVGGVRSNLGTDRKYYGMFLSKLCASWPRNQIFNNYAAASMMRNSRALFAPKRIFVVQNRVDLQHFARTPLSSNGQVRIVGVGSLLHYKRWDRLLQAAAILKKRGFNFFVEIVGDGPMRQQLENRARALDVTDRVKFVGFVKDVSPFLSNSTFLAHTSDLEGCPNVVIEAMACGRAVVATDAGDIPFLVEDGKTGFVVRRGEDDEFVERLAMLISDRELCREMGEAGRTKAEQDFALPHLIEETMAAYRGAGWMDA